MITITYRTPDPAELGLVSGAGRDMIRDSWYETETGQRVIQSDESRGNAGYVWSYASCGIPAANLDEALIAYALGTGRRHLVHIPTWAELGASDRLPFLNDGRQGWAVEQPEADEVGSQLFGYRWDGAKVIDHFGRWWLTLGDNPDPTPETYMKVGGTEPEARWSIALLQALRS